MTAHSENIDLVLLVWIMAFVAFVITASLLIRRKRNTTARSIQLKKQVRESVKAHALVIAIENSSSINLKGNSLSIQLLLRAKLDDGTIEEGMATWNVKPAFIPQIQPGRVIPVLVNKQVHRFYPDVTWAKHDVAVATMWEKQMQLSSK